MTEKTKYNEDTVAVWKLPLADGIHEIEFEHGTATGKRIIRLDGKVRQFSYKFNYLYNIATSRDQNFSDEISPII